MSAETLEILSMIAYLFAFVFAMISVVLFFKLNVKAIIDDLSGKKAERQIRAYREQQDIARKKVAIVSEQRSYYDPVSHNNETVALGEEATILLDNIDNAEIQKCNLLMDEMIIHTEEVI